jgi:hypothetical protein
MAGVAASASAKETDDIKRRFNDPPKTIPLRYCEQVNAKGGGQSPWPQFPPLIGNIPGSTFSLGGVA